MSASVSEASPNHDETEKLVQYQELTGVDDLDQCRRTLQLHGWDVEAAVLHTLNEADGMQHASELQQQEDSLSRRAAEAAAEAAAGSERSDDEADSDDEDDGDVDGDVGGANVLQPINRAAPVAAVQPHGLLGWSRLLLLLPFRWFYDLVMHAVNLIRHVVSAPLPEGGASDVEKFIRYYQQQYGSHHPPFYQGTYSQAVTDAKKELQFLFVYLHSTHHQDTDEFCRHSISDENVIDIINTNGLFWACDVESSEGYRVSRALRENTYPFLAVIVLKNNQMTVVSRIEGRLSGPELHQALLNAVRDNEAFIIAARADREERSFNQTLREEQDRAYQASLEADRQKARRRQEEEERQLRAQQQLQQREQEAADRSEAIVRRRTEVAALVPEEPPEQNTDSVRVLIKMPSGARLERRFLKSQSIKVLYFYVASHSDAPENFHITTNFPRRTLNCEPSPDFEPPTFEDLGFGKSEMFFVQDNDS